MSESDFDSFWKSFDDIAEESAETYEDDIVKVFNDLNTEIIINLNKQEAKYFIFLSKSNIFDNSKYPTISNEHGEKYAMPYYKEGITDKFELFDVDEWEKTIEKETEPEMTRQTIEVIQESLTSISLSSDDIETEYEKLIKDSLGKNASKISDSINTINSELKSMIQKILLDNPFSSAAELFELIKKGVNKRFDEIYKESRARAIARTSATNVTGFSQSTVWTDNGFKLKWLTQRDKVVRSTHMKADGQDRGTDGMYNVGNDQMPYPGAGAIAEENVNCRCQNFPVK